MNETPLFFAGPAYRLFGVLHLPEGEPRGAFVFCHPFAEEKLWAHRVFVSFARQLAAAGFAALRFDYMGNGDSEGRFEHSSLSTARADVRSAIEHLRGVTGVRHVSLLGLRLGGTIASLVAEESDAVDRLVMWAPIVDGNRYVQDLLRINLTTQMAVYKEIRYDRDALVDQLRSGAMVNVDGYELSRTLYEQLAEVKLSTGTKRFSGPCLITQVDRQPGRSSAELVQLSGAYPGSALASVQEEPFWKEIGPWYSNAPALSAATLEWLTASLMERSAEVRASR